MASSLETSKTNVIESNHLEQEEEDGILFAMNLATSVAFPLAVKSAIELGIFNILAKDGEGAKLLANYIASQIGSVEESQAKAPENRSMAPKPVGESPRAPGPGRGASQGARAPQGRQS